MRTSQYDAVSRGAGERALRLVESKAELDVAFLAVLYPQAASVARSASYFGMVIRRTAAWRESGVATISRSSLWVTPRSWSGVAPS